ncbi:MAG: DNA polymerase III subunit gamma/tau, partial [Deltaproteobacteria bacterium]
QTDSKRLISQPEFEPAQVPASNDLTTEGYDTHAVRETLSSPGYLADQDPLKTKKTWEDFLKKIENTLPFMFALLSKGSAKEKGDGEIIVELKNCSSFDKKRLESKSHELKSICKEFLKKLLTINILSPDNQLTQSNNKTKQTKAKQAAFTHPLVVEAQKIFNGEILNY